MRRHLIIATALCLGLSLVACSDEAPDTDGAQDEEFFTGTPDEFWQLMIACYDEHGIEAHQDGNSLRVKSTLDTDNFLPIEQECLSRIPRMPEPDEVPEDQLRRMHAWRVEQYECMVDQGYLSGQPLSFEEYLNHREETNSDWSAINELDQVDMVAAFNTCPEATNEW